MADDKKISELVDGSPTVSATDEFVVARAGANNRVKLGTMAAQNSNNVAITGGTIAGVSGVGHAIKEEGGAALTQRANLNFIGAGVTATDNAGTNATDITIVAGGATGTRAAFTTANLTAGILTVTHTLGLAAPYSLLVTITDNNNNIIVPTSIIFLTNTFTVDLLFATNPETGAITGNWGVYYI